MLAPPTPANEAARLQSLRRMNLLSSPAEEILDCITRTMRRCFVAPIVLISLVDENRQWFKSRIGLDAGETPRSISFCGHAIAQDDMLIIHDALDDERFFDNPLVTGPPHIRSYVGMPLKNAEGYNIGTLCLADTRPRRFDMEELQTVRDFARLAEMAIENRRLGESQMHLLAELDEARRDALLCPLSQLWNRRGFEALYERELVKSMRDGTPLALAAIDIDRFKSINDTHGHGIGDRVIRLLADILRKCSRTFDIVARVGGEEFLVLMPGITPDDVKRVGMKLVQAVRTEGVIPVGADAPDPRRFTVSVGALSIPLHTELETRQEVLTRVDEALYTAKRSGRDRLVVADRLSVKVCAQS